MERPRSLVYVALGFAALVVLLASDAHWGLTLPLSLVAMLLVGFGLFDLFGSFEEAGVPAARRFDWSELKPPLVAFGSSCVAWVIALRLAVAGTLWHSSWLSTVLMTATSIAALVTFGRLLGVVSDTPLQHRHGFWLVLLGLVLYVPLAGSYSLIDPWETHYGEVSREMLARDDWFSFWWAQEGWFWSKPPLDFWLQGLGFVLGGVRFGPDAMLSGAAEGALPQPEWAARLPIALSSLVAVYALYRCVAAAAGKRAGLMAGVVLLCAPYWSLLAHQSMTDMPYVAPLTIALAAFGLGMMADPDERVAALELSLGRRTLRLSLFHALFALVMLTALPQLAYLLSRNVTLQLAAPPYGFRWHWDEFFSGSGLGNCGLPGNEPCRAGQVSNPMFQPFVGVIVFGAALGYLLHHNRQERRKKRLYYLAAWYFTALAMLGKGAPGLVLPLVIVFAVLIARRDWPELLRSELGSLGLMLAAVALPWYVQEYMRHGDGFSDRLLFHDMYKRAFVHVHDTNVGSDVSLRYYLWQLGYGLFPWTGLAPFGIGMALHDGSAASTKRRDLAILVSLWLLVAFALFTLTLTKFHHYALPCAPPLAVGVALLLDRSWERDARDRALGVLGVAAGVVTLLVARDLATDLGDAPGSARLFHLVTYNYKRHWPESLSFAATLWSFGALSAACSALWLWPKLRAVVSGLLGLSGVAFCAFTLWIYLPALAPHFGQRELFLAYYQRRHGPEEPICAYQMNWKGENFYTGNHLPAFVTTGAKFTNWLNARRKAGTKTIYFVVQHERIRTLETELGTGFSLSALTDKRLNDKFALVRAKVLEEHGVDQVLP